MPASLPTAGDQYAKEHSLNIMIHPSSIADSWPSHYFSARYFIHTPINAFRKA